MMSEHADLRCRDCGRSLEFRWQEANDEPDGWYEVGSGPHSGETWHFQCMWRSEGCAVSQTSAVTDRRNPMTPQQIAGYVAEVERVFANLIPDPVDRFTILGAALMAALCDIAPPHRDISAAAHIVELTSTLTSLGSSIPMMLKGSCYDA